MEQHAWTSAAERKGNDSKIPSRFTRKPGPESRFTSKPVLVLTVLYVPRSVANDRGL